MWPAKNTVIAVDFQPDDLQSSGSSVVLLIEFLLIGDAVHKALEIFVVLHLRHRFPDIIINWLCIPDGALTLLLQRTQWIFARWDRQVLFGDRWYLNKKVLRNACVWANLRAYPVIQFQKGMLSYWRASQCLTGLVRNCDVISHFTCGSSCVHVRNYLQYSLYHGSFHYL